MNNLFYLSESERCMRSTFSCHWRRNPCTVNNSTLSLCKNQTNKYKVRVTNRFLECGHNGSCRIERCKESYMYYDIFGQICRAYVHSLSHNIFSEARPIARGQTFVVGNYDKGLAPWLC